MGGVGSGGDERAAGGGRVRRMVVARLPRLMGRLVVVASRTFDFQSVSSSSFWKASVTSSEILRDGSGKGGDEDWKTSRATWLRIRFATVVAGGGGRCGNGRARASVMLSPICVPVLL